MQIARGMHEEQVYLNKPISWIREGLVTLDFKALELKRHKYAGRFLVLILGLLKFKRHMFRVFKLWAGARMMTLLVELSQLPGSEPTFDCLSIKLDGFGCGFDSCLPHDFRAQSWTHLSIFQIDIHGQWLAVENFHGGYGLSRLCWGFANHFQAKQ